MNNNGNNNNIIIIMMYTQLGCNETRPEHVLSERFNCKCDGE